MGTLLLVFTTWAVLVVSLALTVSVSFFFFDSASSTPLSSINSVKYHSPQQHANLCHHISGLHTCCFYSFIIPTTCVIITDPVEATLETIARFAFQYFGYMSAIFYFNQVSSHSCSLPSILHTSSLKLPSLQGREPKHSTISVNFRVVFPT